jgi:hypothetical protein
MLLGPPRPQVSQLRQLRARAEAASSAEATMRAEVARRD